MLKAVLAEAGRNAPVSPRQEMAARLPALRVQRALFGCGVTTAAFAAGPRQPPLCAEIGWNHGAVVPLDGGAFFASENRFFVLKGT